MSKNKSKKFKFSSVSFLLSLPGSILASVLCSAILYFFTETGGQVIFYTGVTVLIVTFFSVYLTSWYILHPRIKLLESIYKNIAKKRFDDYSNIKSTLNDEISLLIKRSVRASNMVEKELQRLNKIENYRKEFIGDISHELKTPIFAIQGFIETLLNGALHDDEVNEAFLKKAMRNVSRLTYLTKDLMEISRLETGELKSDMQEIYLRDLVLDVVESLQYKSQKEQIDIRVTDFDKNIQIRADRSQIRQVMINLIENGIKYNRENGKVEIGVREHENDPDKVKVYVSDSGIGIDKKDIPRVTERFFRVDKSRSREKGGTGLGLAIVKHIIEAHGENLIIESNREGSTFSFTLSKVNHALV